MTWRQELKAAILRYAMRQGRLDFGTAGSRIDIITHLHECEPDVKASSFTPWALPGATDLHENREGLRAEVTCACGQVKNVILYAEASLVDLLAGILG